MKLKLNSGQFKAICMDIQLLIHSLMSALIVNKFPYGLLKLSKDRQRNGIRSEELKDRIYIIIPHS